MLFFVILQVAVLPKGAKMAELKLQTAEVMLAILKIVVHLYKKWPRSVFFSKVPQYVPEHKDKIYSIISFSTIIKKQNSSKYI